MYVCIYIYFIRKFYLTIFLIITYTHNVLTFFSTLDSGIHTYPYTPHRTPENQLTACFEAYAYALYGNGNFDDAIEISYHVLRTFPDNIDMLAMCVHAHIASTRWASALVVLETLGQALSSKKRPVLDTWCDIYWHFILCHKAYVLCKMQQKSEALLSLRTCWAAYPNLIAGNVEYCRLLVDMGRPHVAEAHWQEFIGEHQIPEGSTSEFFYSKGATLFVSYEAHYNLGFEGESIRSSEEGVSEMSSVTAEMRKMVRQGIFIDFCHACPMTFLGKHLKDMMTTDFSRKKTAV